MHHKKLGFYSILLLSINSIVGAGIFLNPGSVAKLAGIYTPGVFLAASLFALILALSFASASRYVSENGAAYTYAKVAFGKTIGSYVGVSGYVANSVIWSVTSTGVIKIIFSIFQIKESVISITIGLMIFMFILYLINSFGLKILVQINNLSTVAKSSVLVITIIAGLLILLQTKQNHISLVNQYVPSSKVDFSVFVTAIVAAFYAFTGFETIASGSKDMDNPTKNLPRVIPITILVVAIIYIGVVSVAMMINPVNLVVSKEVVLLSSIFENLFLKQLIILGAVISMFGINVAYSFHIPRVLEAMAKEKVVPYFFVKRNQHGIPQRAFLLSIFITIFIAMSFKYTMDNIMVAASVSAFIQYLIVPLSVLFFYFGKAKEKIEDKNKHYVLDVVIPILSIFLVMLLLVKFDWHSQFTLVENGVRVLNIYAVLSMIIGMIILPVDSMIYQNIVKNAH